MTTKTRKATRTLVSGTTTAHTFDIGVAVSVWPSWTPATVYAHCTIRENGRITDTLYLVRYANGNGDRVEASELKAIR